MVGHISNGEVAERGAWWQFRHLNVVNIGISIRGVGFFDGNVMPRSCIVIEHYGKRAIRGVQICDVNLLKRFECRGIVRIGHDTDSDIPIGSAGAAGVGIAGIKRDLVSVQRIVFVNFRKHGKEVPGSSPIECKNITAVTRIQHTCHIIRRVGVDGAPAVLEVVINIKVIVVRQGHGFALGLEDGGRAPSACVHCATDGPHVKIERFGRETTPAQISAVERTWYKMIVVRTRLLIRISSDVNFPLRLTTARCPAYISIIRSSEDSCHTRRFKTACAFFKSEVVEEEVVLVIGSVLHRHILGLSRIVSRETLV